MQGRIWRHSFIFGFLTFLARATGFLRDMVMAWVYGAGPVYDAYLIAWRLPNFFRRLIAEGALTQAFVPMIADHRAKKSKAQLSELIAEVMGGLTCISLIILFLCEYWAPQLVHLLAPGFDAERLTLAVRLARLVLPYLVFVSLTAVCTSVFIAHQRFALPAIGPVVLNIVLIGSAIWGGTLFVEPIEALVYGALLAGLFQLCLQIPALWRLQLFIPFRFGLFSKNFWLLMIRMVPSMAGASVAQVNFLLDILFGSYLMASSVSWLYFANRLTETPLSIFAVAVSMALMSDFSQRLAVGDVVGFNRMLRQALKAIFLLGAPSSIFLMIMAKPIVVGLFQYGEFDAADVVGVSHALIAYSVGLTAAMGSRILLTSAYAQKRLWMPVGVAFVAVGVKWLFNLLLTASLQHVGLALATSIGTIFQFACLFYAQCAGRCEWNRWVVFFQQILVSSLVFSLLLYQLNLLIEHRSTGWMTLLLHFFAVLLALAVYRLVLYVLGWTWHEPEEAKIH